MSTYGNQTSNPPLATPSAAGLMSAAQFSMLQNVGEYQSVDFDATVSGDIGVWVPQQSGRLFVPSRWAVNVVTQSGTCTTAPIFGIGTTSPTFANYLTASTPLSTTQVNAGVRSSNNLSFGAFAGVHSADLHAIIQTPAAGTGGFALTMRLLMFGFWTTL